jgi:hypothetical protein
VSVVFFTILPNWTPTVTKFFVVSINWLDPVALVVPVVQVAPWAILASGVESSVMFVVVAEWSVPDIL